MTDDNGKTSGRGLVEIQTSNRKESRKVEPNLSKNNAETKSDKVTAPKLNPFDELVGTGVREPAFTGEDARKRQGNFLVPFGVTGSGKTTFLASLFKYINQAENLSGDIQFPEQGKVRNYAGQSMLNRWDEIFSSRGRFLRATPIGNDAVRELAYEVTPTKGQKTKLRFSVVEVSGEDLKRVVAREGKNPRLPDAIEAIFKNTNLRTMIVLVVHPETMENDLLFKNLFTWLNQNVGSRLKTFSLAILIANPDLALTHLKARRADAEEIESLTGPICKVYLKEFVPNTYAVYCAWNKNRRAIISFNIGQIERSDGDDGEFVRIIRFDMKSSAKLFGWIYWQFTGRRLGATWWQRFIQKMHG